LSAGYTSMLIRRPVGVVTGRADVGSALVTDPGVDMVSVTGSTRTGREVRPPGTRSAPREHGPAYAYQS